MRRAGHHLTGMAAGVLCAPLNPIGFLCSVAGGWLGGVAPDWLEFPVGGRRLIPHRRVTHWMTLWVALAVVAYSNIGDFSPIVANTFLGFACGGLAHCLGDLPNPAGVPLIHPWERTSLDWWLSGKYDWTLGLGSLGLALWLQFSANAGSFSFSMS
jgi:inner membrane protein